MDATLIAAIASAGGVAVTALVTAIILSGRASKPWELLADERGRRAKAEADRDVARQNEQRIATDSAIKDKTIDELAKEVARLQLSARPAPGHGTDELLRQVDLEADGGGADATDLGGDPAGPVPRATGPGSFPVDTKLRG